VSGAPWSPSGDRIAYTLVDDTDPYFPAELRVIDPVLGLRIAFVRTLEEGSVNRLMLLDVGAGTPPDLVENTNDYRSLDW